MVVGVFFTARSLCRSCPQLPTTAHCDWYTSYVVCFSGSQLVQYSTVQYDLCVVHVPCAALTLCLRPFTNVPACVAFVISRDWSRLNDEEVPYTVSLDLSRRVQSTNVNLYLIKVRRIKHRLRDASRLLSVASDGYPQLLVCENL